jgi:lipoate-protein ligase A
VVNQLLGANMARVEGISDLTINGRKFSGNSQYRKSSCVLVHGTFLLNFDPELIERYLAAPAKQPAYRGGRSHVQFVTNLNIDSAELCDGLRRAWQARDVTFDVPFARIAALGRERYQSQEWSAKF